MAPTVEELVKTSTLLTPPQHRTVHDMAREIAEAKRRYANLNASVPVYRAEPAGLDLVVSGIMVTKLEANPPLMEAVSTFANRFEKFALGVGQVVGRAAEASRPFFEGLATLVEAGGRWIAEEERRAARRRASVEALLWEAYQACEALNRCNSELALKFLRDRFKWRNLKFDHVTALWLTLRADHDELLIRMLRADEPVGWLAAQVAFQMKTMKTEFPSQDTFSRATDKDALTPEDAQELAERNLVRKKSQIPPPDVGAPRVRPAKKGMKPLSKDDPFLLVPAWHGDERQTLEEIARHGRSQSRPRARGVIEYHDRLRWSAEPFDRDELLAIVGGENGLRAFRETAENRLGAVRESGRWKKL